LRRRQAGRAKGDWNASVHMLAMQATVDYNETKERCRSRIPQLDLDNAPTNWEDTTKKMFALKSFSRQATSKGKHEDAASCSHAKSQE